MSTKSQFDFKIAIKNRILRYKHRNKLIAFNNRINLKITLSIPVPLISVIKISLIFQTIVQKCSHFILWQILIFIFLRQIILECDNDIDNPIRIYIYILVTLIGCLTRNTSPEKTWNNTIYIFQVWQFSSHWLCF